MKRIICLALLGMAINGVHSQQQLSMEDSRGIASTPVQYNFKLKPSFKYNSDIGLNVPGNYSTVLGLRGWWDDSGGKAHEIAFTDNDLYIRFGYDSGWEGWRKIISANSDGDVIINDGILTIGKSSFGNNKFATGKNYINFGSDWHGSLLIGSNLYLENNSNGLTNVRNAIYHPTMSGSGIVIPGNGQQYQGSIIFHTSIPGVVQAETPFNSPRLIIDPSGNIGIGIITPTDRLAVNGNIRAREIKVETNNWPDYVFEEEYKLTPLTEVETFIKANKHLPDVPSSKQIEEDGLSVGEMNKLMMKKIEELTLHLIEKDKQLQQQNTFQQTLLEEVNMLKEKVNQQANEINQLKNK
ncbi:Uncharacterised protein [Sphingobacterium spiritivorum]|uniref:Uncharacterized protein n=1 Tax=Sphingobacterium spiritivorum TaxID=258 RepID=A0A380BJK8_SPHSI|nr:hypothetical protein [Sphingobacterium spiritivorum]SUJ02453.1 Uncharacterised protein [Sphingobacterium spiritivorum]